MKVITTLMILKNLILKKAIEGSLLKATNNYSFLKDVNIVCVCVHTPLDIYQQPDLSYIKVLQKISLNIFTRECW